MRICSLASGSSGNCIYVGDEETHILIDVGISKKRIVDSLEKIEVNPEKLHGILITHEHSDHIKGLGVMSRKYHIPIYTTIGTWRRILKEKAIGVIDTDLYREIRYDENFSFNEITVHPFRTSHDASEPVCYTFSKGNKKISVATDLGCYDDYIKEKLRDSNVLFIEANHDVRMLEVGSYPYFLKQRILSDVGHLSNETSGRLISELLDHGLTHVVLGHLSKENNVPEVAFETVKLELAALHAEVLNQVSITVAHRDEISNLITI